MRIRTIKPEFWSHPVTGKMEPELQALAIGLLNYADDDGFFYADPTLVRSALRPFDEDSTSVRRSIEQLQKTGFFELKTHQKAGKIGFIPGFAEHQRVDRPRPSTIKKYWENSSTNDRRMIDEASTNDQRSKGRERNGREANNAKEALSSDDDVFGIEALVLLWNQFAEKNKLAQVRALNNSRRSTAKARLQENPGREFWETALRAVPVKPVVFPDRKEPWTPDFDWFMQPSKALKYFEKAQAGAKSKPKPPEASPPLLSELPDEERKARLAAWNARMVAEAAERHTAEEAQMLREGGEP